MEIRKLEIKLFEFCRPGKDVSGINFRRRADFLLDSEPVSHTFDALKKEPYAVHTLLDTIPPAKEVIQQFCGIPPAADTPEGSQGDGRFVLYTLFSPEGSPLGSVSCMIERSGNLIVWKDIHSEGLGSEVSLPDLTFDYEAYQAELEDYIDRNPVTLS